MSWDSDGEISLLVRDFFVALAALDALAARLRPLDDVPAE